MGCPRKRSGLSLTMAMRFTPSARICAAISRHGELPVDGLAAGHGDCIVVEDLVGDAASRRDGLADGEASRMEIGAVADVGEDVLLAREGSLTRPIARLRRPSG